VTGGPTNLEYVLRIFHGTTAESERFADLSVAERAAAEAIKKPEVSIVVIIHSPIDSAEETEIRRLTQKPSS